MSTKIYTGFYLDTPIAKVIPVLKDIKKQLEPMTNQRIKDAMCSQLAGVCINNLNDGKGNPLPLPKTCTQERKQHLMHLFGGKEFLSWAADYVEAWADASENPVVPEDHMAASCVLGKVILFPYENRTLGIAIGPSAFTDALRDLPQVHDFCYWNNSDKLPGISDEDWQTRGNVWHDLIQSFWTEDDGLTYTLFSAEKFHFYPPEAKDVDAWLVKNRPSLISQRAGFLLRAKIAETTPQKEEESHIHYFLRLNDLAQKEIQKKTNLGSWALYKAKEEVPTTYEGIVKILLRREQEG